MNSLVLLNIDGVLNCTKRRQKKFIVNLFFCVWWEIVPCHAKVRKIWLFVIIITNWELYQPARALICPIWKAEKLTTRPELQTAWNAISQKHCMLPLLLLCNQAISKKRRRGVGLPCQLLKTKNTNKTPKNEVRMEFIWLYWISSCWGFWE